MKLKLIIAIGNPDPEYQNTYHNVGFLFVDFLKSREDQKSTRQLANQSQKSEVYMNESGKFAAKALKQNNTKPDQLLLVHDDSDITLGNYKLSFGRNSAGHKGVESVMKSLKTKNFWRLRIGIRPPNERVRQKAEKFVLKKISSAHKTILEKVFAEATKKLQ